MLCPRLTGSSGTGFDHEMRFEILLTKSLAGLMIHITNDREEPKVSTKVIAEILELSPGAKEHISDLVLVELVEELHHRGQPGRDASRLVGEVQRHWSNERG
jgi:hypothetical protein